MKGRLDFAQRDVDSLLDIESLLHDFVVFMSEIADVGERSTLDVNHIELAKVF